MDRDRLPESEDVHLAGLGGFHLDVPGHGQMYVQYARLRRPRARFPLICWHGGGLTGASFENKPGGGPGWQWYFLSTGHDVYLCDGPGAGRARSRQDPAEQPARDDKTLWELFRIGPPGSYPARSPYADSRFPVAAFDEFASQVVRGTGVGDASRQAVHDASLAHLGPCVLLTHSAAGPIGLRAEIAVPDHVRGHVLIEPSGAPDPAEVDLTPLKQIPHLFIWGDHLNLGWHTLYDSSRRFHEALLRAGGRSEWIDLPEHGRRGNTHLIMMDDDSDEVAALISRWMSRNELI
ncbi:hypothetical protein AB0J52_07870 [Spirillospora sp. NPDC049652]